MGVIAVQYSRQAFVDMSRKGGYFKAADEAARELPDPVDLEGAFAVRGAAR
jgi:hypothetical protein